ncbi:CHAT domain-containing protein [Agromyces sp. NPDC004153]
MRWRRRRRDEEGRLASALLSDLQYGSAHLDRARRTGAYDDADAAVRLLRSAVSNPLADGAFLTGYRTTLAEALLLRANLASSNSDLDEATEVLALTAAGPYLDPEAEVRTLCAVSELHDALARANSNPAEADVAIEVARRAVAALSPAHPETLNRVARALERRADMSGDRADFDEAVATYRLALERAESEEPSIRVAAAVDLAAALGRRYERYAELADLDESIGLAANASATAETEAERASALRTLAQGSAYRYWLLKRADDLRSAIRNYRDLLQSGGRSRREIAVDAMGWANLAIVIGGHYDRDDAITSAEAVLKVLAPGDPGRDLALHTLGIALFDRWTDEHRSADLDRAVEVFRAAASADPHSWVARHNLGVAMLESSRSRDNPDLTEAAAVLTGNFERGVDNSAAALLSAQILGDAAAERGEWALAAETYRSGLVSAQLLVDGQLGREHKEGWLAKVQQMPVEAAYAAMRDGDASQAVWSLETHRARLLTETLAREAAELDRLDALGHQDLRTRFEESARQLAVLDELAAIEPALPWRAGEIATRRQAKASYDDALAELGRMGADLPSMLGPAGVEELQRKIGGQPFAFVGASRHGGFALLLIDGRIETLDFPHLTSAATADHVGRFRQAYGGPPGSWRSELGSLLAWASDAVMAPLIDALGTPTELNLVPVGYLGLVPLHAAPGPQGEPVLAATALSYQPNLRFLRRAQRRAERSRPLQIALGVDGFGDGQPRELERVKDIFPELRMLRAHAATATALPNEISRCGLVHFSCHARSDLVTPLDSVLAIADSEIDLRSILRMDLSGVRLAVLAACETNLAASGIPDEPVTLLYGLLEAGAAAVVGSLWRVDDSATTVLMNRFYEELALGATAPAALARAQNWLRSADRAELSRATEGWPPTLRSGIEDLATRVQRDLGVTEGDPGLDAEAAPFADPYYWAAFAHVGA